MPQLKIKDNGVWVDIPAGGVGVPSGGTTGQVLQKSSNTDYATEWATRSSLDLVWENPSPTSDFAAQDVAMDLSKYDAVYIGYKSRKGANAIVAIDFIFVGTQLYAMYITNSSSNLCSYSRAAWPQTDKVEFNNCNLRVQGQSSSSQANDYLIPKYVYGVKF